jgi:hypothetical protein
MRDIAAIKDWNNPHYGNIVWVEGDEFATTIE